MEETITAVIVPSINTVPGAVVEYAVNISCALTQRRGDAVLVELDQFFAITIEFVGRVQLVAVDRTASIFDGVMHVMPGVENRWRRIVLLESGDPFNRLVARQIRPFEVETHAGVVG